MDNGSDAGATPAWVRELVALFTLAVAVAWLAYVFTRPSFAPRTWITHPVTGGAILFVLLPHARASLVRRAVLMVIGLVCLWLAGATATVWTPFALALSIAYFLRFLSRALRTIHLPGGRVLRLPRFSANAVIVVAFVSIAAAGLFVVVPGVVHQTAQLAEGAGVAYREAFRFRTQSLPLQMVNPNAQPPQTLAEDVSAYGKSWPSGTELTSEVRAAMRQYGVTVVTVRTDPLLTNWLAESAWVGSLKSFWQRMFGDEFTTSAVRYLEGRLGTVTKGATDSVAWFFSLSGRVLSSALGIAMVVIFSLIVLAYFLPAREAYVAAFFRLFPEESRGRARRIASMIDDNLTAFLRGQMLVVACVSVLSALAYWLAGTPFPLLVGVVGGLMNTIPNVGVFLVGVFAFGSLVVGTIVGLEPPIALAIYVGGFNGFLLRALLIPVAVEVVQLIDNSLISPRVMSQAIHVDPLLIMFSVLLGGTLFGFWGVLLAVPALVVIKSAWDAYQSERG